MRTTPLVGQVLYLSASCCHRAHVVSATNGYFPTGLRFYTEQGINIDGQLLPHLQAESRKLVVVRPVLYSAGGGVGKSILL